MKNIFALVFICFKTLIFSQDMVVGDIVGQLGNQMFIIAATECLARENNAVAVFPDLAKLTTCNTQENREKIFYRVNTSSPIEKISSLYREPCFHYKKIPYKKNLRLQGYFQSEKYFARYKEEICQLFAPSIAVEKYLWNNYSDIILHPNTVSIHFRDYLKEDPERRYHPNCSRKYFKQAIEKFPGDVLFVVFSNNMEFCKKKLSGIPGNFRFIEKEHFHHDFYLMSMCRHNIISNSSFSWWAAYLNKNPNKIVIAPSKWFVKSYILDIQDILPKDWIKIS